VGDYGGTSGSVAIVELRTSMLKVLKSIRLLTDELQSPKLLNVSTSNLFPQHLAGLANLQGGGKLNL
jgi:hypothetical protein